MNGTQSPTSEQVRASRAKVETALVSCGIHLDTGTRIGAVAELASDLGGKIVAKAVGQATYDHLTNIPAGIVDGASYKPVDSLRRALPHALGTYLKWDVGDAIELAADILEDVNAHRECALVRSLNDAAFEAPTPALARAASELRAASVRVLAWLDTCTVGGHASPVLYEDAAKLRAVLATVAAAEGGAA